MHIKNLTQIEYIALQKGQMCYNRKNNLFRSFLHVTKRVRHNFCFQMKGSELDMDHKGTVTLETERLILRRFKLGDADAMFRNWANDPEVTRYLTWPTHSDVSVSRFVIGSWLKQYENLNYYSWAIVLKEIDEPIGSISAVMINELLEEVEVGYCIGRKWWRQGYTSEALAELIRFFFEEVGVNRIKATHDVQNPNSGKVMQKCGMKYEGTMRQGGKNNQGLCDVSVYAIIAKVYFAHRHN